MTKRQEELANAFLFSLDDETRHIYRAITDYLSQLGYTPQKQGAKISFKHNLHNKQMAKMGITNGKTPHPFFALRFSACKGYSQRFADIVSANITKYPKKRALCTDGNCHYCKGAPDAHVYSHTFPDGQCKTHCGAYVLEIPDISADDVDEIKNLISEEHDFLLKHEAEASNNQFRLDTK